MGMLLVCTFTNTFVVVVVVIYTKCNGLMHVNTLNMDFGRELKKN